jgi:hypothetical protein
MFQNVWGKNNKFQVVIVGFVSKFADVQPQTRKAPHKCSEIWKKLQVLGSCDQASLT